MSKHSLIVGSPKFTDICLKSDRYFLFLSLKNGPDCDPVDSFIQDIATRLQQTTDESDTICSTKTSRKHHYAVVNPALCLKHKNQTLEADWLPLDHLHTDSTPRDWNLSPGKVGAARTEKEKLETHETAKIDSSDTALILPELIHSLADKLPLIGHYLDIIWLVTPDTDAAITDHISLYGALQRLCSWHGGLLTVVRGDTPLESPHNDTVNAWLNCLHGRMVRRADVASEIVEQRMAWRGEIVLADCKGQQAVCVPGLVLSFHQRDVLSTKLESKSSIKSPRNKPGKKHATREIVAFSTQMEVVCSVHRADVPSIYLSSSTLSLHLLPCSKLPRSEFFLDWLMSVGQSDDAAVIVRLPCRKLTSAAPSSRSGGPINTKAWKERIKGGSGDLSIPDLHLRERQCYFHLLVHSSKESGNRDLIAHVMYSPREMNGAIHAQLVHHQDVLHFDQFENAKSVLKTIPRLDERQVKRLLETIEAAQAEAIKIFIEEKRLEENEASITAEELELLMRAVYSNVLAELDETSQNSQADDDPNLGDEFGRTEIISEIDGDPSEWMERLALQNLEALERKIKRFKSGDMMLAGLPVPVITDNTITLTAEAFLKHFQTNGLPSTKDLSPVSVATTNPSNDRPNLSWSDIKKATFKESQEYTHAFPGVQYCLDSAQSLQLDNRLSKMQQRYIRYETASTCSSDQTASPATLTIPQSSSSVGDPTAATSNPTSATSNPTSATNNSAAKKGKGHPQKDKYSPRGLRALNRGARLVKVQKSAEKRRRIILDRGHRVSPRNLSKGVKRTRKDVFISPSKRRISPRKRVLTTAKPDAKKSPAKAVRAVPETTAGASSTATSSKPRKMSNSEKNRMKLRQIVKEAIMSRGITKAKDSEAYKACLERLYRTAELYVKDLKSSKGLSEEMRKIVEANADFVVQFEQNRIKKSLR